MTQAQQQPQLPETIAVEDLDQFVRVLSAWHTEKCGLVQHLLSVPEGAAFEIGDGAEAETIVLTPDVLKGFKLGIEMTMMQLGTLPFVAEIEAVDAADAAG